MVKKLSVLLVVAASCCLSVPSRAGDGNKDKNNNPTSPACANNSVPLNEGVVFLTLAGLALGATLIYNARTKKGIAG